MNIVDQIMEKLPPLDEKNRNFVIGGIMLAIFGLFYVFAIGPQLGTLNKVNPKVKVLKEDIERAETNIQKMNYYQAEVKKLNEELDMKNERIKKRGEVPLILEEISRIANQHNVKVDQMMPLVEKQKSLLENDEGEFFNLPILLEAKSGYHDFGRFLNQLETDNASLVIEKFNFDARAQDRMSHAARLTLSTVVFDPKEKTDGQE